MHKKVVIDNNIIDFNNIAKLNNTNIFELIYANKISFLVSEKLFDQLVPFLKGCSIKERKDVVDFIRNLIGKSRILDTVMNISHKELEEQAKDKFWFISSELQKNIDFNTLEDDKYLDSILSNFNNKSSAQAEKQAHNEIIKYMDNQRKIINDYSKKAYKDIDKYLIDAMKEKEIDSETINAILCIVKNISNENLTNEEKKKVIYTNYYNLMQEFSLLLQLRDSGQLIKNKAFFNEYYKDYYNIHKKYPFTKTMLDLTKFGYSYKVLGKENPSYDKDWINDNSYLCYMNYADILLTNDNGYMKDAFNSVYANSTKEILTLDEFIIAYCSTQGGN